MALPLTAKEHGKGVAYGVASGQHEEHGRQHKNRGAGVWMHVAEQKDGHNHNGRANSYSSVRATKRLSFLAFLTHSGQQALRRGRQVCIAHTSAQHCTCGCYRRHVCTGCKAKHADARDHEDNKRTQPLPPVAVEDNELGDEGSGVESHFKEKLLPYGVCRVDQGCALPLL